MNAREYLNWSRFLWWNYKLFAIQLMHFVDVKHVKRILDLGCGNGLLLDELKIFFPDALIIGLDLSKDMLTVRKHSNQVVIGKSEYSPFESNSFDIVTSTYSLHEFNVEKSLREIHRLLKDGGIFAFKEINCDAPEWALFYLKSILTLFFDEKTVKNHIELYNSFVSPKILKQILKKNGFKILEIKEGLFDFTIISIKKFKNKIT